MNFLELALPGRTVAGRQPLELGDVLVERRREERSRAIGEQRAGRVLGVEVLEAVPREVLGQLPRRRRAREERVPRTDRTSWVNPGSVRSLTVRIAPPRRSLRSSTDTRQPARESSAAEASELTPEPTRPRHTPACSETYQLPEFSCI